MEPDEDYEKYIKERIESAKKIALEVIELSKKVRKRNKTLYNLVRLLFFMRWGFLDHHTGDYDMRKYAPRRGRKGYDIPLGFVMAYLAVSHRTAQDYIKTIQAIDKLETLIRNYVPEIGEYYLKRES